MSLTYTAGRTCSIVVPNAGQHWFGFDLPNLIDAGNYVIGWGMTYDINEPGDLQAQKLGAHSLKVQQIAIKLAKYGLPTTAAIAGAGYELMK